MTTTTLRTTHHPDLLREAAGAVLFSRWKLGTSARLRTALDTIAAVWEHEPWPDERLLGYWIYEGEDGETLLHHTRWTDEDGYGDYARDHRQARVDEVDSAVPGIERLGLGRFHRYRSGGSETDTRVPGCVAIVDVEFDGPDADRQRAWVDTVFDALKSDPAPHPGLISAHFHVSTDGTRVINYAEWETAQAHIEAVRPLGRGNTALTPDWQRVRDHSGISRRSIDRFHLAFGLVPR